MGSYLMNSNILAPSFLVFSFVYVVSFFLALGYEDWFMIWVGLEMNMMSFMSLSYLQGKKVVVESLFKYFFIQSLASGAFLMMMYFGGSIVFVMGLKLAAGPFYFWLPSVVDGVEWVVAYVLLSFQKLLPLIMLSGLSKMWLWPIGMVGILVGVMGSFGQSNLKKLMTYSSVGHVGWMMMALLMGGNTWLMYYFVYIMVLGPLIFYFVVSEVDVLGKGSSRDLFFLFVCMLSLSGMPPLFGFVMKWVVLQWMVKFDSLVVAIMIFASLVMFYIYIRVVYDGLLGGGSWMDADVSGSCGKEGWMVISIVGTLFLPLVLWGFF